MQSQPQQSSGTESDSQVIPLSEPAWLTEYVDNVEATSELWDWYAPELAVAPFSDCPYLCDDGLLWKPVEKERVVDVTEIPLDDGDDKWLQQEVFVVADGCFYCN